MRTLFALLIVLCLVLPVSAQNSYWNSMNGLLPGGNVAGLYQNPVSGPPVPLPVSNMTIEAGLKIITGSRSASFDNGTANFTFSDFAGYSKDVRLWEFNFAVREKSNIEARYAYLARQEDKFVVPGALLSNLVFGGVTFGQGQGQAGGSSNRDIQFTTWAARHRLSVIVPVGAGLWIRPAMDVRVLSLSADADTVLTSGASLSDQRHSSESWSRGSIGPALFMERTAGSWTLAANGAYYPRDKGYTVQAAARYKSIIPIPIPLISVGYWVESFSSGPFRGVWQGPYLEVDLSF
jgi:hypothetical protein